MKEFFKKLWDLVLNALKDFDDVSKPAPTSKPEVTTEPQPIPVEVKPVPPTDLTREIANFKFVDSSHHHREFDPKKYTAKILSNKCTQGDSWVDDTFAIRKKLCKENNIKFSGYHFFECKIDPIKQCDHYMKTHGAFELPPQVDFETYKTKASEQTENDLMNKKEALYILLCELEKRTGMTPWIYINYGAAGRLKFDSKFARFPVWFARYNSFLGEIPAPWSLQKVAAWQYTESEDFPGFVGDTDVNIYFGKVNVLGL